MISSDVPAIKADFCSFDSSFTEVTARYPPMLTFFICPDLISKSVFAKIEIKHMFGVVVLVNQPVITYEQYRKHFLTEKSCYEYLYRMKWPEGYRCSKCLHDAFYVIMSRGYPLYECKKCGHQTTLTVGTIFEKTRTDITIWFGAIFLVVQDINVPTASIANELDINYETAWTMVSKIRKALANPRCIASAPRLTED